MAFKEIVNKIRKIDTKNKVTQGYKHQQNITSMFQEIIEASIIEFREDNWSTLESFLDECYNDAKKKSNK